MFPHYFSGEIFFSLILLISICRNLVFKKTSSSYIEFFFDKKQQFFFNFIELILNTLILYYIYKNQIFFPTVSFYDSFFVLNESLVFIKIVLIFCILVGCNSIFYGLYLQNIFEFEFISFLYLVILSSLLLIHSTNLIMVYILIELQSICFYILVSFKTFSLTRTDLAIKYFILNVIISVLFLLGLSTFFFFFGNLSLYEILTTNTNNLIQFNYLNTSFFIFKEFILEASVILIYIFFFFKIGVIPVNSWLPDTYEAAPLSTTIFISTIPKFALLYFISYFMYIINFSINVNLDSLMLFCGLASIIVGNILGLGQKRLKRYIIYSTVGHMGFILIFLQNSSLYTYLNNYTYIYFFYIQLTLF